MHRTEPLRAVCVSIHDVAPATWLQCERLLRAVRSVADIPVSLLVVPAYHRQRHACNRRFERALEYRLARGDELVLHGYTHLDEAPRAEGWRDSVVREIYTRREGEFYAIDSTEARRRLQLGCDWFAQRGWPLEGFVAPAWLMGEGGWRALADFPFSYTTTLRRFHLLRSDCALRSQSLVYTVRSSWRRHMSRGWNAVLSRSLQDNPLLRISLHPIDAAYPDIVRHFYRMIESALEDRQPMTKAAFANAYQAYIAAAPDPARRETAALAGQRE
ncbi:DUF2334 domain-containing protein [Noviherbaspirillum autotrophicum]|uniref:Deacetylase n=1 Tax=Noviherbaspirillum autotrophicum TaxID=709839 RepID=A0A0C2BGZ2_9BURK|nr:polysaccharide deacetylase family protein [Noviherbaspirillum autotrophicum]KIF80520.1 hypothetical protein TSA66_06355 [Noviherbaspirillum autotrophicum]